MVATAIQQEAPAKPVVTKPQTSRRKPISWERFQSVYLTREDGYKYEWVNGMAEKTERTMDRTQLFLWLNLYKIFQKLQAAGKVAGALVCEPDLFFLKNHRRPDVAWLTENQYYLLADPEAYAVPGFVIEVVSKNDQVNDLKEKMDDYRAAGVEVAWLVFPKLGKVDVYSGPGLTGVRVCSGKMICSAAPALPGFEVEAAAIFERKTAA